MTPQLNTFLAEHEGVVLAALSAYATDSRRVASVVATGEWNLEALQLISQRELPEAARILSQTADRAEAAAKALRELSKEFDNSPPSGS